MAASHTGLKTRLCKSGTIIKRTSSTAILGITEINLEDRSLTITFDGNKASYDITELDEITLAYAITVHKIQGSEYKIVVAPFSTQCHMMLKRNLLYTCVKRARSAIVIVGTKKAVAIAVGDNRIQQRNI